MSFNTNPNADRSGLYPSPRSQSTPGLPFPRQNSPFRRALNLASGVTSHLSLRSKSRSRINDGDAEVDADLAYGYKPFPPEATTGSFPHPQYQSHAHSRQCTRSQFEDDSGRFSTNPKYASRTEAEETDDETESPPLPRRPPPSNSGSGSTSRLGARGGIHKSASMMPLRSVPEQPKATDHFEHWSDDIKADPSEREHAYLKDEVDSCGIGNTGQYHRFPPLPPRPSRSSTLIEGSRCASSLLLRPAPPPTPDEKLKLEVEKQVNAMSHAILREWDKDGAFNGVFGGGPGSESDDDDEGASKTERRVRGEDRTMSVETYLAFRTSLLDSTRTAFSAQAEGAKDGLYGTGETSEGMTEVNPIAEDDYFMRSRNRPRIVISTSVGFSSKAQLDTQTTSLEDLCLHHSARIETSQVQTDGTFDIWTEIDQTNVKKMSEEILKLLQTHWSHPVFWEEEAKEGLKLDLGLGKTHGGRNVSVRAQDFLDRVRGLRTVEIRGESGSENPGESYIRGGRPGSLFHNYPGVDVVFRPKEDYDKGFDTETVGQKTWDQWRRSVSLNRSLRGYDHRRRAW